MILMARLMNLDEAIEHCLEKADCTMCGAEHKQLAEWLQELKQYREQPTVDAVEVVRCKDCKHYKDWDDGNVTCKLWTDQYDTGTEPDAFCSFGEKMDGGKNEPINSKPNV